MLDHVQLCSAYGNEEKKEKKNKMTENEKMIYLRFFFLFFIHCVLELCKGK